MSGTFSKHLGRVQLVVVSRYFGLARLGTVIDFTTRVPTTPKARVCCNSTLTTLAEKLLSGKYSSIADTDLARLL